MSDITPCLWFDRQAEDAARFYVSVVPRSRLDTIMPSPVEWPGGSVADPLIVEFTLADRPYQALNGGPAYRFTPALSLSLACDDQHKIDRVWAALSDGGQPGRCGLLTDRYGVSWQIVPTDLAPMLKGATASAAKRVMDAVMDMEKLDLARLQRAAAG